MVWKAHQKEEEETKAWRAGFGSRYRSSKGGDVRELRSRVSGTNYDSINCCDTITRKIKQSRQTSCSLGCMFSICVFLNQIRMITLKITLQMPTKQKKNFALVLLYVFIHVTLQTLFKKQTPNLLKITSTNTIRSPQILNTVISELLQICTEMVKAKQQVKTGFSGCVIIHGAFLSWCTVTTLSMFFSCRLRIALC